MIVWIAEEILEATDSTGKPTRVVVRVGTLYHVGVDEWACSVAVDGLHVALPDIHGVSSLQPLCLAASAARSLLAGFIEQGGQLCNERTKEPFDISATFSGVGGGARLLSGRAVDC